MKTLIAESAVRQLVSLFVRLIDAAGAIIIFTGAVSGFVRFVLVALVRRRAADFTPVRLDTGRFVALGIEFQLASDLLRTAVAPTFDEIGKLAAVAAIRTALNYFLGREIRDERAEVESREAALR